MLYQEVEFRNGSEVRETVWAYDGTVNCQMDYLTDGDFFKTSPPWWWNVTDQTAPSMPAWMKDDEQWQRALDAQD